MPDIDERLEAAATAWQYNADHGARPVAVLEPTSVAPRTYGRRSRTRILAPVLAVLSVLLVGATAVVIGNVRHNRIGDRSAPKRATVIAGLRFQLPNRWRVIGQRELYQPVANSQRTRGLASMAKFLGPVERWNGQAVDRPCTYKQHAMAHSRGFSIEPCPGPAKINPGGISVTLSVYERARGTIAWNTTVAGRPARFDDRATGCAVGVPGRLVIIEPKPAVHLYLSVCFGAGAGSNRHAFDEVLATARINGVS